MSTAPTVVTLTLAGAIDATYRVGALRTGAFVRAERYEREVSGKGVNVAAAVMLGGRAAVAVVVMGEEDVAFAERSTPPGLLRIVPVPGATRVNTSIIDGAGATTKVNAPAPPLDPERWEAAVAATLDEIEKRAAGWLVVSGTVPVLAGTGRQIDLGPLLGAARERGALIALDTSGDGLARALAEPHGLSLIKPNTEELAELTGRSLRTMGDVEDAARSLVARGVTTVFASLGADGLLVVGAGSAVHAAARARSVVNTAGAGDASLAGFLLGLEGSAPDDAGALPNAASVAASWGAHAVAQSSTIVPGGEGMPPAVVDPRPDRATELTEPA